MEAHLEAIEYAIKALNEDLCNELGRNTYQLEMIAGCLEDITKRLENMDTQLYVIGSVR